MADIEKTEPAQKVQSPAASEHEDLIADRPAGWKYKARKLGPITIPWFASPEVQIIMIAFVCFLCPGMFNAVNGLGGGGQVDAKASTDSNTALYSTFAFVGFFAGSIANWLGIKVALSFGGIGYCIYVASYLSYSHNASYGFSVFAGFLLGICAGILWAAQGCIMLSYPPEQSKGRYIAVFWMIFNLGGVIGALVPLGQNIHTTTDSTVTDGTYIGFIVLTACGALLSFCLVDAKSIIRKDGSRVILNKNPTWKTELLGMWETVQSDYYIIALFPVFFASNWFYTYHFNDVNLAQFNTRTRALNNVLYWSAQIAGALICGTLLDMQRFKRTTRAKAAWISLFVLTMVVWGGGYEFQTGYSRAEVNAGSDTPDDPTDDYIKMDWTTPGYVGPMFLYIFYGMYDAIWQCTIYWLMGAMTNNSRKLANYAGFYKGLQSAGAAIMWRLDGLGTPYWTMFSSVWGLLAASLIVAAPVMLLKIKDTVALEDDLKMSDETADEVLGHKHSTTPEVAEKA